MNKNSLLLVSLFGLLSLQSFASFGPLPGAPGVSPSDDHAMSLGCCSKSDLGGCGYREDFSDADNFWAIEEPGYCAVPIHGEDAAKPFFGDCMHFNFGEMEEG